MLIYWLNISIIVILGFFYDSSDRINTKYLTIVIVFLLIFIGGMRSSNVGTDTPVYVEQFRMLDSVTNEQLLSGAENAEGIYRDPVFYIVAKSLSTIYDDEQFIILIFSLIFPILSGIIFYKFSKNVILSFLVVIVFRFFDFTIMGMRQGVALSLTFYSYLYIYEKKPIKFLLINIFASFFHFSALIFLFAYLINLIKIKKNFIKYSIILIVGFYLAKSIILSNFVMEMIQNTDYSMYSSSNTEEMGHLYLLLYIFFYGLCLLFYKRLAINDTKIQFFYKMILFGILAQIAALNYIIFYRIALYFTMFFSLLIPEVLEGIEEVETRNEYYFIIIIGILFVYWIGGPSPGVVPYTFFWE